MDTRTKREILMMVYPGGTWRNKVMMMSDNQVHAVYMRLLEQGKLKGLVK